MKKVVLLFTICFGMVLNTFAHDFSAVNSDGKTIYYNITSNTKVEVTYKGSNYYPYQNQYSGVINIPESVTYNGATYSVTSIGEDAFHGCEGVTDVTIPSTVTKIRSNAFYDCKGLVSISIPETVTSIEGYAFCGCNNLENLTFPSGLTGISERLCVGCKKLTSIVIPEGITSIGEFAFSSCSGLTSVILPATLLSIETCAFASCTGLTNIDFPEHLQSIGMMAFEDCKNLTGIIIPNGVYTIGSQAFQRCIGLTDITIPKAYLEMNAFRYCTGLTNIVIGDDVHTIGARVFDSCINVSNVVIGKNVDYIYENAFSNLKSADSIIIKANTPPSVHQSAFLFINNNATLYVPCGRLEAYTNSENWSDNFSNIEENNGAYEEFDITICSGEDYDGYTESGTYEYTSTSPNGCVSYMTLNLVVNPADTLYEEVYITQGTEYYWEYSDETYTQSGTYIIEADYVDENGCYMVAKLILHFENALQDIDEQEDITLYPNPTSGDATLSIEGLNEDMQVLVCDIQGKVVYSTTASQGDNNIMLETSNLPAGVYYVKLIGQTENYITKLIKE